MNLNRTIIREILVYLSIYMLQLDILFGIVHERTIFKTQVYYIRQNKKKKHEARRVSRYRMLGSGGGREEVGGDGEARSCSRVSRLSC